MLKRLFFTAAVVATMATAAQAKTIYGYQTWEPMMEVPTRGPIKFESTAPDQAVVIADCSNMGVVYGGFYYNYHWYGQVIVKGTQSSVEGLYDIDMATGQRTLIAKGGSKMIDMTYDYSTDKVYGIRSGNSNFAEFNMNTGASTIVGKFAYNGADVYMLALAASMDGKIYGVSSDDNLYLINKSDASLTKVGNLGVDAGFDQTMAFDYDTNTLYWANNNDYILYTIDTATGQATAVGPIGLNGVSSMGSLFLPFINVPAGAPDRVTGRRGEGGASSVVLTWTNPSVTAQGQALGEIKGVRIQRDGLQIADITMTADKIGSECTYTDEAVESGKDYSYSIVPYNSNGTGGVDTDPVKVHVGKDVPGPVGNLKATAGDGSAILTWTAPTKGANNGQFDVNDITGYQVKRGARVVATTEGNVLTYEDKASFGTYEYTVTPVSTSGNGTPATITGVLVKPADWIVMTNGEARLQDGVTYTFYDEGGPNGNYRNSQNMTLTIAPAEANSYVVAEFTSFNLETYGDYMAVYQGAGVAGQQIGKFAATTVPAGLRHIESTTADGALTFVFYSDVIESAPGWAATVKTIKMKANDLEATSLTASAVAIVGDPTEYVVAVANKGVATANSYKVELLSDGNVVASVDVSEPLVSMGAANVTITYKPTEEGDHVMTARVVYAADDDTNNNVTAAVAQRMLPQGSKFVDLYAESPSTLYVVPFSFMSSESISEVVIKADELADAAGRKLNVISYPLSVCTMSYAAVPFEMWVGETDRADLTDGTVPASALTKAFDSTVDIVAGDDAINFTLSTPVEYSGRNLVILLHKKFSATDGQGVNVRGDYDYDKKYGNCTRFDSNNEQSQPFDPESTFGYSAQGMRPDMRLIFGSVSGGVDDITVDTSADIKVDGTGITAGVPAEIYNAAGQHVASLAAGQSIDLPAGLYIVSTASESVKVSLR